MLRGLDINVLARSLKLEMDVLRCVAEWFVIYFAKYEKRRQKTFQDSVS